MITVWTVSAWLAGQGLIVLPSYTVLAKKIFTFVRQKKLYKKNPYKFFTYCSCQKHCSVKRLQLHHMLVFGYTSLHSHCSACLVLLYSWLNNRLIKLDNIFYFLKF